MVVPSNSIIIHLLCVPTAFIITKQLLNILCSRSGYQEIVIDTLLGNAIFLSIKYFLKPLGCKMCQPV